MRIVRISYRVPPMPGGQERHVDMLTREQLRRGHRVCLAHRHGEPVPGAEVLPLASTLRSRALSGRNGVLAFGAEVAHALRRPEPADLVHVHGDHLDAAQIGPACRHLGVPLVLTVHAALNLRHRGLGRWALRHVDAFVALGARPAADLLAFGVEPEAILTASSGVDLAAVDAARSPGPREPGLVVSVGSLDPLKDHATAIEAVHRLRRTNPAARLVIAGDGPLRAELARAAGDDGAVTLAGALPREAIYALVSRAEAFVLASRRLPGKGEGVPTAALEALACATPVVLSTAATLDPVVAPSVYRTFPAGDAGALAAVLAGLLGDEDGRRRAGAAGRAAAEARAWPRVAAQIEDWYATAFRRCARRGVFGHRLPARV